MRWIVKAGAGSENREDLRTWRTENMWLGPWTGSLKQVCWKDRT